MSLLGGPSGTADIFMQVADYFKFTIEEKLLLRAGLAAWMVTTKLKSNIFQHIYIIFHYVIILLYICIV
jgi:hypothetical protein